MRARVQATLSRLGFDRFHPTPILWSGSMRGCSLMVKPQSSKLITRVRFPSSPRGLGSRRFRVEALFFFPRGDDGNPFRMRICFLARSEPPRRFSGAPHFSFSTAEFLEPAFTTPGSRGTSRACVRRFLPCGWWCRIAGTPHPGACTRSSRARARPQFREYRGGPRARW